MSLVGNKIKKQVKFLMEKYLVTRTIFSGFSSAFIRCKSLQREGGKKRINGAWAALDALLLGLRPSGCFLGEHFSGRSGLGFVSGLESPRIRAGCG